MRCNTRKSDFERYVLSTLPLGSSSEASKLHHLEKLPRRFKNNPKLRDSLATGMTEHWLRQDSGLFERRRAIPLDSMRFEGLFEMVARGLTWHHWSHLLERDVDISVRLPYHEAEFLFSDTSFDGANWRTVGNLLGGGAVEYQGWQSRDVPSTTFWGIRLLGGVLIGGGANPAASTSSMIGIITAPAEFRRVSRSGA